MTATAEEAKKVTLRSSDGVLFEVEESAVMQSEQIKYMVGDDCSTQIIPVANVTGNTLAKVIEYLRKHATEIATEEELKAWDAEYIKVDLDTLYDLILAANYLNAKGLLELCCQTVADIIKGKTPEQIRKTFNIKNDFTPEEAAEMRREYAWLYED